MNTVGWLHFIVGCVAILTGFLALFSIKGSPVHKQAGVIYVVSTLLLSLSGFYLSYVRELQFTFLLSGFALYLVLTGWESSRNVPTDNNLSARLSLAYSALLSITCLSFSALGIMLDWPYPVTEPSYEAYAFIGACVAFFMLGDIKQVRYQKLNQSLRTKRHITRIGSSMLIATSIFFLGNNNVLPESLRTVPVLVTPIITVCVIIIFYRFAYQYMRRRY